jgi:hypothetical protein
MQEWQLKFKRRGGIWLLKKRRNGFADMMFHPDLAPVWKIFRLHHRGRSEGTG